MTSATLKDVIQDIETEGNIVVCSDISGSARYKFFSHFIRVAEQLSIGNKPYSNIVSGMRGIGKTATIKAIIPRIALMFRDICCVYVPCRDILKTQQLGTLGEVMNVVKKGKNTGDSINF